MENVLVQMRSSKGHLGKMVARTKSWELDGIEETKDKNKNHVWSPLSLPSSKPPFLVSGGKREEKSRLFVGLD